MPTTRSNKHTTSSADVPMVVTTIAVNTTTTTSNTAGLGTIVDATSPSYATPPDIPGAHGITTIAPSVSKANSTPPTTVLVGNVPQTTIGTSPGNVPILNPAPGMVPPASSAQPQQYLGYGLGSVPQYGQTLPTYPNPVNHAPTTQSYTTPSHHPVLAPPAHAGPPGQPAPTTAVGEEDATPSRVIQFMRSQTRLHASHEHDIHEIEMFLNQMYDLNPEISFSGIPINSYVLLGALDALSSFLIIAVQFKVSLSEKQFTNWLNPPSLN